MAPAKAIRCTAATSLASSVLMLAIGGGSTLAAKPESVPPRGSTCGAFYGSVVASEARSKHLSGDVNPGVLHQGFAGAEAFPFFSCP